MCESESQPIATEAPPPGMPPLPSDLTEPYTHYKGVDRTRRAARYENFKEGRAALLNGQVYTPYVLFSIYSLAYWFSFDLVVSLLIYLFIYIY